MFIFQLGQSVTHVTGGLPSLIVSRFKADSGLKLYEVRETGTRRKRTFLEGCLVGALNKEKPAAG